MMTVSIIIPTLKPPIDLYRRTEQLLLSTHVTDIHIVHNHPRTSLPRSDTKITHHFLGTNRGFTGACNFGAQSARGTYLLFLNDDCVIEPSVIDKLTHFLDTHTDICATQPIVYDTHGQIEHVGFEIHTTLGRATPIIHTQSWSSPLLTDNILRGLSGTCLLVRKKVFVAVGMFDESFHSYLEDVDLALTLHEGNLIMLPCIDACVIHTHMHTSSQMGTYKQRRDLMNWCRIIYKHPQLFIRYNTIVPLLIERMRNISGLLKQYFR